MTDKVRRHLLTLFSYLVRVLGPDEDVETDADELLVGDEGVLLVAVQNSKQFRGPGFRVLRTRR